MIRFLTNLYNAEISQAILLVVSLHEALIAILKFLGTLVMESVFNIVIGDRLGSLNCLKRTLPKDIFLGIY